MSRFGNLRSTVCIAAGLLILFLAGCQAGGAGTLRLRGENWSPSPGGAIRASDLGSADLIDLEGDLGLGEEESLWVYAVERIWDWELLRRRASTSPVREPTCLPELSTSVEKF